MQLCNVEHPNSQKNTCLLSMFMAGDSTTNLHTCLDMYSEQVSALQGMGLRYVTVQPQQLQFIHMLAQRSHHQSLPYRGL